MTIDPERTRSKLDDISRSIGRLRRFQTMERTAFLADEDSQDIARSRLLTAIEAALNICYHVTARKLRRVPEEYAQCFVLLGESGLLPADLAERLAAMARFRNRLVHLYWDVDFGQVYDIIARDLGDLQAFSQAAASWL
ncbi:MAG: DUF86 domain-containing protein [Syntrophobacteraceae bacterium]|jgi:uncharacterized protein YutE (UPF0331/DUF86 family)|nr:DUF86 domain-containing protein [Syntrophobacteraceae bacterium]